MRNPRARHIAVSVVSLVSFFGSTERRISPHRASVARPLCCACVERTIRFGTTSAGIVDTLALIAHGYMYWLERLRCFPQYALQLAMATPNHWRYLSAHPYRYYILQSISPRLGLSYPKLNAITNQTCLLHQGSWNFGKNKKRESTRERTAAEINSDAHSWIWLTMRTLKSG